MKWFVLYPCLTLSCLILSFGSRSQTYSPAKPYGEEKLIRDFFCSEVIYPEDDIHNGVEGEVIISFIVEKDGALSKTRVTKSVSPEIDAEALRLFRLVLWEPAISMGQPVASENQYSIEFDIKKYNKHCKQRGYTTTEYPYLPVDTSNTVYEYLNVDKKPYAMFDVKGLSLGMFISQNIKYPESAYRQNLSGKVTLRFVVEPSGRVSNIRVLNPVGGGCTQEAIRLLELIKWMPGIESNMAVRTFMNLDIEFKLPEDSDMNMFENGQMNSN